METFIVTIAAAVICGLAAIAIAYIPIAMIIQSLAERNIFFSVVEEGTAKAIMVNERFGYLIMSYLGHTFKKPHKGNREGAAEDWDVVKKGTSEEGNEKQTLNFPLLRHVFFIGFWPFVTAYVYTFAWATIQEALKKKNIEEGSMDGEGDGVLTADGMPAGVYFRDRTIDYILLQEYLYATYMEGVECRDKIPLNLVITFRGKIVNPYKALFRVEQWLDATIGLLTADTRNFIAIKSYGDLIEGVSETEKTELFEFVKKEERNTVKEIEDAWGFEIKNLQIFSLAPGSELAEDFIRATTKVYVAEQQAKADEAEGKGLASRDKQHFEAVAAISHGFGPELFRWQSIKDSGLTTYVEGGGSGKAIISVPTNNTKEASDNASSEAKGGSQS